MKRANKELLERAFRARAGMIGVLEACNLALVNGHSACTFPIEPHATDSGHHEACPGHAFFLSQQAVQRVVEQRKPPRPQLYEAGSGRECGARRGKSDEVCLLAQDHAGDHSDGSRTWKDRSKRRFLAAHAHDERRGEIELVLSDGTKLVMPDGGQS